MAQSVLAVTVTVGLAWGYCLVVLFMDETVLGIAIRHRYLAIGALLGLCLTYGLSSRAVKRVDGRIEVERPRRRA